MSYYPSRLQIHFDAGAGASYKRASLTTSFADITIPGQTGTDNTLKLAGTLGFGGRYQITPHILLDVVWRYFHYGSVNFPIVQGLTYHGDLVKATGLFLGGTFQY